MAACRALQVYRTVVVVALALADFIDQTPHFRYLRTTLVGSVGLEAR